MIVGVLRNIHTVVWACLILYVFQQSVRCLNAVVSHFI